MRNSRARLGLAVLALGTAISAVTVACDGNSGADTTPVTASAVAGTSPTAAAPGATAHTTAATEPKPAEATPSGTIEVQGVVGAVDVAARTIDIKPTGDAKYTKIILSPATTIKRAGGGSLRLQDVRPSDRIIAFGRPGDDPTTLLSTDVTVQAVVPGAQPGG
jgi:hypothetical protein